MNMELIEFLERFLPDFALIKKSGLIIIILEKHLMQRIAK